MTQLSAVKSACWALDLAVYICVALVQDAVVAKQYMSKNKDFQQQAKEWTQTYAAKPSANDRRVGHIVMGSYLVHPCNILQLHCMCSLSMHKPNIALNAQVL